MIDEEKLKAWMEKVTKYCESMNYKMFEFENDKKYDFIDDIFK